MDNLTKALNELSSLLIYLNMRYQIISEGAYNLTKRYRGVG